MCYTGIAKKLSLLIFFVITGVTAFTQTLGFRFFPIKDVPLISQGFIGKIDSRFFLLNRANSEAVDLFIYDTLTNKTGRKTYPFPRQVMSIMTNEKSIVFIGVKQTLDSTRYHYLEVDAQGELIRKKDGLITVLNLPLRVVNSSDEKYTLLYQYLRKGTDSAFIQGSLIGTNGELKKQLAYSFKHDKDRDDEPEIAVDNNGNTHVLVFDKYSNYRISTELTLNTMMLNKEEISSEVFSLQKVKLKNMRLFQNTQCNCMQAEGMYTDGTQKVTQGLYSIAFPFVRKNELIPRFAYIGSDMIKNFKKGFSATEATIRNSLQLQEMVYSDSGSFAVMRLSLDLLQQPGQKWTDNGRYALPRTDLSLGRSVVMMRAGRWNAPKLIYLKMAKENGIEWQTTQSLDVFSFSENMYNRVFLIGAEQREILTVLYQASEDDEPHPVLVSMKDGLEHTEKFPEKRMVFSPVQLLGPKQYGSLYLNTSSGEGGVMLIEKK